MDTQISRGMIAFGGFHFDIDLKRLLHQDAAEVWMPVAAGPRALEVLAALLREPGALVTKNAIMRQVWPSIAVEGTT